MQKVDVVSESDASTVLNVNQTLLIRARRAAEPRDVLAHHPGVSQ